MKMDVRRITDRYHVSPQIEAEDIPALRDAGFTTIICNRPDIEVPPSHQAEAIGSAARAAGMTFVELPVTHQTLSPEIARQQADAADATEGKVLAYCASGTRSTIVWALGQAGSLPTDEILNAAAEAGYDLGGMRPTLEALSGR